MRSDGRIMFSATMDEYQNFGLYADLLTDDPAKFRGVYNALAGSTGKVDALRYNYSSQLLDYSKSVRGADGWALIGTFGGDVGFAVDAARRAASGEFSDVAQEIAAGYAIGKVLGGASWIGGKLLRRGGGVEPLVDQAVPLSPVPDEVIEAGRGGGLLFLWICLSQLQALRSMICSITCARIPVTI